MEASGFIGVGSLGNIQKFRQFGIIVIFCQGRLVENDMEVDRLSQRFLYLEYVEELLFRFTVCIVG